MSKCHPRMIFLQIQVDIENATYSQTLWKFTDRITADWTKAQIQLLPLGDATIRFTVIRESPALHGYIKPHLALDDVYIDSGLCPAYSKCYYTPANKNFVGHIHVVWTYIFFQHNKCSTGSYSINNFKIEFPAERNLYRFYSVKQMNSALLEKEICSHVKSLIWHERYVRSSLKILYPHCLERG